MDENKLRELNNQTNNITNEKGNPGSKGNTTDGPMDHTYPQGAAQRQGTQQAGDPGMQQSGMGPGDPSGRALDSGSMQTQQSGGTGATQGITDSHQRQMEERSSASGQIEQPVGAGTADQGVSVGNRQSADTGATNGMNPQNPMQPELQGGAMGSRQGNAQSSTQGGGQRGPLADPPMRQGGSMGGQQSAMPQGTQGGGQRGWSSGIPSVQGSSSMSAHQSVGRPDSQAGASEERDPDAVHESNDSAGGLPRAPGGSGPWPPRHDTHLSGAQNEAERERVGGGVHESNDLRGGLPRSPGGANKLAADEKMDDDTGFSNPGH